MYAARRLYVKNWSYVPAERRYTVQVTFGGKPAPGIQPERITRVEEEVMYWRKANHIHTWFVDPVQEGNDDGGEYLVMWKDLEELLRICKEVLMMSDLVEAKPKPGKGEEHSCGVALGLPAKVIADPSIAKALLPRGEGPFFGSQEYDEDYLKDVEATRDWIESMLKDQRDGVPGDIIYSASW